MCSHLKEHIRKNGRRNMTTKLCRYILLVFLAVIGMVPCFAQAQTQENVGTITATQGVSTGKQRGQVVTTVDKKSTTFSTMQTTSLTFTLQDASKHKGEDFRDTYRIGVFTYTLDEKGNISSVGSVQILDYFTGLGDTVKTDPIAEGQYVGIWLERVNPNGGGTSYSYLAGEEASKFSHDIPTIGTQNNNGTFTPLDENGNPIDPTSSDPEYYVYTASYGLGEFTISGSDIKIGMSVVEVVGCPLPAIPVTFAIAAVTAVLARCRRKN